MTTFWWPVLEDRNYVSKTPAHNFVWIGFCLWQLSPVMKDLTNLRKVVELTPVLHFSPWHQAGLEIETPSSFNGLVITNWSLIEENILHGRAFYVYNIGFFFLLQKYFGVSGCFKTKKDGKLVFRYSNPRSIFAKHTSAWVRFKSRSKLHCDFHPFNSFVTRKKVKILDHYGSKLSGPQENLKNI